MVEVYSTDVKSEQQEEFMLKVLRAKFPDYKINFDLEDRDNILRVEIDSTQMNVDGIIDLMKDFGFAVKALPDKPNIQGNIENFEEKKYRTA